MKNNLIALCLFISTNILAQNGWVQRTSGPQKNRAGHFVIGDDIYYGAGNNTNGTPETNTWFKYNSITDSWSTIASMPQGMQALESFTINGKGYAGMGWYSGYSTNLFYEYNPNTNSWLGKAAFPSNTVHDAGSFVINDEGYILGGAVPYSNNVQAGCHKYNAFTNVWSPISSLPIGSRNGCGFSNNQKGFLIHGQYPAGIATNNSYFYNVAGNSWSSLSTPNGYIDRYNVAVKDSLAYAIMINSGTPNIGDYQFWKFNMNTLQWDQLPARPFVGLSEAFCNVNGKLIAILSDGQVWEYNGLIAPPTTSFSTTCDTLIDGGTYGNFFGRITKTNDHNLITAGTFNHIYDWVNGDIVLNKYDEQLNLIWTKTFFAGQTMDLAFAVLPVSDGGYLIHGAFGKSNAGSFFSAGYLIKTDSLGNQIWFRPLTGTSYGDNYGSVAVENSNGDFMVYGHVQHHTGCSSYATRITKVSAAGNIIWSNCLQLNPDKTGGFEKLAGLDQYISVFNNPTTGNMDLRRWDDNGVQTNIVIYKYQQQFSSAGTIVKCATGGFYLVGNYDTQTGKRNAFVAKFDQSMNLVWESNVNYATTTYFSRATEDDFGNIICTGEISDTGAKEDLLVSKFSITTGAFIGSGRYGVPGIDEKAYGVAATSNGEVVCSGFAGTRALLVKFCSIGCDS